MELGKPIDLQITKRHWQLTSQAAIQDVFDALVELITNCDDSYHRLYKKQLRGDDGGPILIEISAKKGMPSIVRVCDRAEGMTLGMMAEKLVKVGTRSSEHGDRGFMGRGAKDCVALGKVTFESIRDNKFHKAEITQDGQFIPLAEGKRIDEEFRSKIGLERGDGTVVTIEVKPTIRMPRVETIIRELPWHYALRDILSENNPSKVLIRNLNNKTAKPEPIIFRLPEGELVCKESFQIPGYPEAKANLTIWKHPEPLEDNSDKFRRSGIVIKGERAIHDCSFLSPLYPGFEKDPYSKFFFGRLECPYIDLLLDDYDKRRELKQDFDPKNPSFLIDPSRHGGLLKKHPFVKAFFQVPAERLKKLIEKEKEKEQSERKEIASTETKERLNSLAKAASKFLTQQIEDLDEFSSDNEVDDNSLFQKGVFIFPTFSKIGIGEKRTLSLYVNKQLIAESDQKIEITSDNDAVSVIDSPLKLHPHRRKDNFLIGYFQIKGNIVHDAVCLQSQSTIIPKAEAMVSVVESRVEAHDFTQSLEFQHKRYKVKEGSTKTIKIFAKYPELVTQRTEVRVISSDTTSVIIEGKCYVSPVPGTNYAIGELKVRGRNLKSATLEASINGNKARTKIKVVQREDKGIKIEIKLRNEAFGNFRARWAEHEGKPNLLLISAQHPSVGRYLKYDKENDCFYGDKRPHFQVLLAEIVAESVCRKSLLLEAQGRPWEFKDEFDGDPNIVVDAVSAQLQKRIKSFSPIAHNIMLKASEFEIG